MNLKEKAVKGVVWSIVDKWMGQAIALVVFTLLARLLEPTDFGLVALAYAFVTFAQIFLEQGFSQALVQREDLESEHIDAAFWVSLLLGALFTVGGTVFSRPISSFYDEPLLSPIIALLSFNFLIISFSSVQAALLTRGLDFRNLAIRSLTAKIASGIVGVGAAVLGCGVWSLVIQNLVTSLVGVIVLWRVNNWRPRFRFSKKHFKELFGFSLPVIGIKVLNFFDVRLGDFLIGYFLGTTALGYYAIANRLILMVLRLLNGVTDAVAFPTFSRLQTRPEQLRSAFYRTMQVTSLGTFPIFIGMALLAPELVTGLFGSQWDLSAPVMPLLAISGLVMSLLGFNRSLTIALGKPSGLLVVRLLTSVARTIGLILAAQSGIVAVAAAFVITTCGVYVPLYTWLLYQLLRINFKTYLAQFVAPLLGSLGMLTVILSLKSVVPSWVGVYWQLVIFVSSGALTYLILIQLMKPLVLKQLLSLARSMLPDVTRGRSG